MALAWLATVILQSGVAPDAQVAFSARFYYPPGDSRVSVSQVYVSRLDGSRRRQLSNAKKDIYEVQWLGPDHILWRESQQEVVYSLISNQIIKRVPIISKDIWDTNERGRPRPWRDDRYLLPSGGIAKSEPRSKSLWGAGQLLLKPGVIVSWEKDSNQKGESWIYSWKESQKKAEFLRGMADTIYAGEKGNAYIQSFVGGGSAGTELRVYKIDLATGTGILLLDNIDLLDFDPNSLYWSGIEPWRPLVRYGKDKHVWASQIYAGNLKTGKRWLIAKGLVHGGIVQIRPGI